MKLIIIGILILIVITLTTFYIHSRYSTYIGDEGRISKIIDATLFMTIGLMFICINILMLLFNNTNLIAVYITITLIAILCITAGSLILYRTLQENNNKVIETHLVDCNIYDNSHRLKGSPYIELKGKSLSGNKNRFRFEGKDINIMREAIRLDITSITIQYYEASGRVKYIEFIE